MGLTKAAIERPVFIFMLMLAAIGLGFLSYTSMRVELNPDVNFGIVTIVTPYPGAGPEEVNNLISRKVEEAVSGVAGIREVTSTSVEGASTVVVSLNLGVDTDVALNDVRSKVDSIANNLPKDALKSQVSKLDTSAMPVLNLSVTGNLNSRDLRTLIDDKLKDRYGQIPGVASVDVQGGDIREVQVRLRKDKLLAYGIGILDVQRAVAAATLNVPSGKLVSGDREFSVRVLGEFKTSDDIRNMLFTVSDPMSPMAKAKTVHLSDIADVVDTSAERTIISRLNGKENITLAIQKTKDGNAVDITRASDAVSAQIQNDFKSQGISVVKTVETAKQITDSLADLRFALIFGIFLVAVIVYIFLHNFRGMLIVCLAIPTSIFATFIAMKGMGFTVNNMSMLSLSLAIGVLVDDAIVVLENVSRHLRMGEHPKDAAINGRSEIGLAAIAITLADVVVFLPIGTMGGIVGAFFKPMALGFVCAVLFSLFVSFTLTPMLASRWYRAGEDLEHPTGRFAIWFEKMFHKLERAYGRALEWCLNHRWFTFILGNLSLVAVFLFIGGGFSGSAKAAIAMSSQLVLVATVLGFVGFVVHAIMGRFRPKYILYGFLFGLIFPGAALLGYGYSVYKGGAIFKGGFFPDSDSGVVNIRVELPAGASLAETTQVVEHLEQIAMADPDAKYTLSTIGEQVGSGFSGGGNVGSNYGQLTVQLRDLEAMLDRLHPSAADMLRKRSAQSVAASMLVKIGKVSGAKVTVAASDAMGGGSAIQLSFRSDDRALLTSTVQKVQLALMDGKIPGVINPDTSSKPGKPEIQAVPDRAALADAGLTVSDVGSATRTLYQGNNDSKLRVNGREFDIRVMLNLLDRDNPNVLRQVPIAFKQGNPIYLGSVTTLQNAPALDKITRRQQVEEMALSADLLPGYAAGTVQTEINNMVTAPGFLPEGVSYKPLGQADFQAQELPGMLTAFVVGIVLVYMLLASLFDNILYPFIIQLSQPQAMVGALLGLIFMDQSLNLVGFIGLVCLVGLVGKNAILLVDYTNTLRSEGMNRHDALVAAGPVRLKPIMMTTLALILGMLPVALAIGRGSEFRETIGTTIIGGISLSTMLTLLVIPCSYTIFDDMSNWFGKSMRKVLHKEAEPEEPFHVSAGK